jgi:hypothetical protein
MAGQIKVNQVQLGDSATATQNFVWQTNVDGTAKLARGNVGATSQDILTVDASGKVTLTQGLAIGGAVGLTVFTSAVTPLPTLNGAVISTAHGLASPPVSLELELTCLTAEFGYSVGDKINKTSFTNGTNFFELPIWWNASTVGFTTVTTVTWQTYNRGGGSATFVTLTPANWSYRFKMRTS